MVTFYVDVPDVEAALIKAESLGGARVFGPARSPAPSYQWPVVTAALPNSLLRYHVDSSNGAKTAATRQRRIENAIALFRERKR